MKKALIILVLVLLSTQTAYAHCQIPCGIYDDELRIKLVYENIDTIEKSIKEMQSINAEKDKDFNQLVRWIDNKEEHAQKIQKIMYEYFLAQRLKIDNKDNGSYTNQLKSLHKIVVYAMKAKQSLNLENIKSLRNAVKTFESSYFHKEEIKDFKKEVQK